MIFYDHIPVIGIHYCIFYYYARRGVYVCYIVPLPWLWERRIFRQESVSYDAEIHLFNTINGIMYNTHHDKMYIVILQIQFISYNYIFITVQFITYIRQ